VYKIYCNKILNRRCKRRKKDSRIKEEKYEDNKELKEKRRKKNREIQECRSVL